MKRDPYASTPTFPREPIDRRSHPFTPIHTY